ncbi:unnamed protein product [Rotaria sp. Silwood1]|nr:unnamed protein product [Rotaria sp. Silwood1]CAF1522773.1 unnamed protein product [Rotaria sp. Silwood1]CAF3755110.1 unnamed protein product [Rotaria sp. Silwood1]
MSFFKRNFTKEKTEHIILQIWPVRQLDSLFSCLQDSTTAIPGAFAYEKTVICQSLSKFLKSDAIVCVSFDKRGYKMAQVFT